MRKKGLGWILCDLAGDRQAKANAEDTMDIDEQAKSAQVPKTAMLAPGSGCNSLRSSWQSLLKLHFLARMVQVTTG